MNENILKEIQKTGYPFELQVSKNFSVNNWSLIYNSYYIDKDENKGREIDLIAYLNKKEISEDFSFELNWDLIVEIKQSLDKPWVFFTMEESSFYKKIGFPCLYRNSKFLTSFVQIYKIFHDHGTKLNDSIGRSYYEAFANENKRDNIFKGLSGVYKATNHLIESAFKYPANDKVFCYYEPIIILNGPLFEAYLKEDESIEVNQVEYTQVAFNYLSPNYDSNRFIIQIVTLDYLPQFIKQTEEKFITIYEKLRDIEIKHMSKNM